jgi:hypothetical protein
MSTIRVPAKCFCLTLKAFQDHSIFISLVLFTQVIKLSLVAAFYNGGLIEVMLQSDLKVCIREYLLWGKAEDS